MTWTVELDPSAEREMGKLDPQHAKRILRFLFERVSHLDDPRRIGEALKGSRFDSLWKYRVGEFRIICSIEQCGSNPRHQSWKPKRSLSLNGERFPNLDSGACRLKSGCQRQHVSAPETTFYKNFHRHSAPPITFF
jgi:mRNA interferase RelE/StbE